METMSETRIGYIREWKTGLSYDEQKAALIKCGITEFDAYDLVYIDKSPKKAVTGLDRFPQRKSMLNNLRNGDEIVIAAPSVIGTTAEDVMAFMAAMTAKGVSLYVASLGKSYRWSQEAAEVAQFAQMAEAEVNHRRMAGARQVRKADQLGGRPYKVLPGSPEWIEIETMWRTKKIDAQVIVAKSGYSYATLYRLLGRRNTSRWNTN